MGTMSRLEDSVFDPTIGVSNDLKYSLTREKMMDLVANEDLAIVYPKDDELFLDLDSDKAYGLFQNQLEMLRKFMNVINVTVNPSKSGLPNRHVTVQVARILSEAERIALQASLGSDRRCELLRYKLFLENDEHPTLFLERKP
jgi:hypothetical protein